MSGTINFNATSIRKTLKISALAAALAAVTFGGASGAQAAKGISMGHAGGFGHGGFGGGFGHGGFGHGGFGHGGFGRGGFGHGGWGGGGWAPVAVGLGAGLLAGDGYSAVVCHAERRYDDWGNYLGRVRVCN